MELPQLGGSGSSLVPPPPLQREMSHSSADSAPVAAMPPAPPPQPTDINYTDDSQSKSLPGLTGDSAKCTSFSVSALLRVPVGGRLHAARGPRV